MKQERGLRRMMWVAVVLLALIGVAIVGRRVVALVPVLVGGGSAPEATNPVAAQFAALDKVFADYPVLTLVHIIPGLLFMLLGPLQFSTRLRARYPAWHRWAGRVFLLSSLVIGVSALVMSVAMPSIGGPLQAAATSVFGAWFLYALGKAFRHILRREVAQHRVWMIRAFATGLAVATIRPIIGLFFATSALSGLTPDSFFGPAFWIGFVLNTLVAELWIQRTGLQRMHMVRR
ncbi:MAG TPA: DUF2306 domain-containing protein [Roseiflexaceae bacterium]|nr:DUF2306 domain-containing protein [Roseiflexaceae bacterium]